MFDTRAITFGCENADIIEVVEYAPTKPNNNSINWWQKESLSANNNELQGETFLASFKGEKPQWRLSCLHPSPRREHQSAHPSPFRVGRWAESPGVKILTSNKFIPYELIVDRRPLCINLFYHNFPQNPYQTGAFYAGKFSGTLENPFSGFSCSGSP